MKIDEKDLEKKVKRILNKNYHVPIKEITNDKKLEELGMNSLDITEFYIRVEDEIGIKIADEDFMQYIESFGDCMNYIKKQYNNLG